MLSNGTNNHDVAPIVLRKFHLLLLLYLEACGEVQSTQLSGATKHVLLKLPGTRLYLTILLKAKKFCKFGNKEGSLMAFLKIQTAQLGTIEEIGAERLLTRRIIRMMELYINVYMCIVLSSTIPKPWLAWLTQISQSG